MSLALKIATLDYLAAQDGLPQIGVSLQFEIHHDRFSEHLFRIEQFRALVNGHQKLMLREAQSDVWFYWSIDFVGADCASEMPI